MAAQIFVPGLIKVSVAPASGSPLQTLGYCSDGVHIREELRLRPVYGDEGGGAEGVPVDIQYLGQYHILRFELYRFEGAVLESVLKAFSTNQYKLRNKAFDPGWMMRQGGDHYQLELRTEYRVITADPVFKRLYPAAVLTGAPEYGVGVHEMRTVFEFTCYPDASGTIFTVPAT